MSTVALRTSLIWLDEVMNDVVSERPATITMGSGGASTFITPADLGLPEGFAVVRPGRRGYLLTLSERMTGTICIDGIEHDVAAFVRAGEDAATGFRATPIGNTDWGVIGLDASGEHKLFFQFVPLEDEDWNLAHPVILAGVGGFALSVAALTALWHWSGVPLGEAAFRAGSVASLAIGIAAIVRWAFKQDNESRASLAFSVMLHAAILFATFKLYEKADAFTWPGPASTTGTYLVTRLDSEVTKPLTPAPAAKPTVTTVKAGAATLRPAPPQTYALPPTTTVWKPRRTQRTGAQDVGMVPMPNTGVFIDPKALRVGGDLDATLEKLKRLDVGAGGPATGGPETGLGPTRDGGDDGDPEGYERGRKGGKPGDGPGSGGLDTGGERAAVCVGASCDGGGGPMTITIAEPPTDGPGLQPGDIERVVKARQGLFRACYQRELDRSGASGGDLVANFVIGADGRVKSAKITGGSLRDPKVGECVKSNLMRLTFPARGGAIVNFPFMFSSGG